MSHPPVFCFCAPSNSGKTTFLCQLIGRLSQESKKVGVLKSCHHPLRFDGSPTDTDKLTAAGAKSVKAIVSGTTNIDYKREMNEMDIILVEGGRRLGEKIFLLPGWRKDVHWRRPAVIFCDLEGSEDPLQTAFTIVWAAIEEER